MGLATQTPQRQAHRPAPRERNTRSPTPEASPLPRWHDPRHGRRPSRHAQHPQPNLGRPALALFGAIAFRQSHHHQAGLPAWRRCRRAADVAHAAGAADVLLLSWWAGRGKPKLTARDWRDIGVLGFTGYYLSSYLDFAGLQYISASLERLILYLNPTMVLLIAVLRQGPAHQRAAGCGAATELRGHARRVRARAALRGPGHGARQSAGLWQCHQLRRHLTLSGSVVQRLGALRLTGLATTVACVLCIGQFFVLRPAAEALVPEPVIWLSLLNATACTFAPVLMVMLAIAHRRADDQPDWHGGPDEHAGHGRLHPRRTLERLDRRGHGAGAGGVAWLAKLRR